nr:PREDICTED: uncharacterized protein LOC102285890 [Bos mutus]
MKENPLFFLKNTSDIWLNSSSTSWVIDTILAFLCGLGLFFLILPYLKTNRVEGKKQEQYKKWSFESNGEACPPPPRASSDSPSLGSVLSLNQSASMSLPLGTIPHSMSPQSPWRPAISELEVKPPSQDTTYNFVGRIWHSETVMEADKGSLEPSRSPAMARNVPQEESGGWTTPESCSSVTVMDLNECSQSCREQEAVEGDPARKEDVDFDEQFCKLEFQGFTDRQKQAQGLFEHTTCVLLQDCETDSKAVEAQALMTAVGQILEEKMALHCGPHASELNWYKVELQAPLGPPYCYHRFLSYQGQRIVMRQTARHQ